MIDSIVCHMCGLDLKELSNERVGRKAAQQLNPNPLPLHSFIHSMNTYEPQGTKMVPDIRDTEINMMWFSSLVGKTNV